jgi:hypothetical protein
MYIIQSIAMIKEVIIDVLNDLLKSHDYPVSFGRVMRTPEIRSSEEREREKEK